MTFTTFAADAIKWLRFRDYADNTITAYERTYRQFVEYLHTRNLTDDLRQFSDDTVKGYAMELRARGAKASSVVRYLSALSTLAEFGQRTKDGRGRPLVGSDPTRTFDWPQVQEAETPYLYGPELRAVLNQPVPAHQDLARALLVETGLRVSELCRANVSDLIELDGEPMLAVTVKGRRSRLRKVNIPLTRALWERIRSNLLAAGRVREDDPILVTGEGKRHTRSSFASMMVRIGKRAGVTRLDATPHKFRHTANVIAKMAGLNPDTRSHLLNHADPRSQRRYDHIVRGELHAARDEQSETLQRYIGQECRAASSDGPEHLGDA